MKLPVRIGRAVLATGSSSQGSRYPVASRTQTSFAPSGIQVGWQASPLASSPGKFDLWTSSVFRSSRVAICTVTSRDELLKVANANRFESGDHGSSLVLTSTTSSPLLFQLQTSQGLLSSLWSLVRSWRNMYRSSWIFSSGVPQYWLVLRTCGNLPR
jgi:hypothetical protein